MAFKVGEHYEKPIASGEYYVQVVDLIEDVSYVKRTQQYNIYMKIVGSNPYAGRGIRHTIYITEKAYKMLAAFFIQLGVPQDTEWEVENADETWEVIKGRRAKIVVAVKDVKGMPMAEVVSVKPVTAEDENKLKPHLSTVTERDSKRDFEVRDKLDELGGSASSASENHADVGSSYNDGDIPF